MILSGKEIYQIQFVLPIQGNLETLESAAQILNKANVKEEDADDEKTRDVDFSNEEIHFLREMISLLNQAKKLNINGLSFYHKILNIKE